MKKILLFAALIASVASMAEVSVRVENQKMVLNNNGQETILTPNGADASYFWCSVSPDEQHIVYTTAFLGTYVCDLNGEHVQCMGRMNAPKWLDNEHVAGMQEFYDENDEIDHVRYISRNLKGRQTRDLTLAERSRFIELENARLVAEKARQHQRLARRAVRDGETGLNGIKIYVNAGHGGYDANDRSCWTIPVPETWSNPDGYWESKSNLTKSLALRDLLEGAGAEVIMSRTVNTSGIRDVDYYPGATPEQLQELTNGGDRDLSAIAEEANANNVDHFISVHSNAQNGKANYLLMLYHGENGKPTVVHSDEMAASSGSLQIQNQLTVWTSSAYKLYGDITFYGDKPTDPYPGLGVLRPLTVPGFLSEGSFHDYAPETHRLMNADYCKLEALRMYQHFHHWFNRALPQTATISGWVKSSNEKVDILNQKNFYYVPNTDDQWLPLNGATVELLQNDEVIATYTTDDWYNGIFAFYDLTPGTYVVRASLKCYRTETDTITVAAEQIAGVKMRLKNVRQNKQDFPEEGVDIIASDMYTLDTVANSLPLTASVTRMLYRGGHIFTLENGEIRCYDLSTNTYRVIPVPANVVIADIALSADDFLIGKVQDEGTLYIWDDDMQNAEVWVTGAFAGNSIASFGCAWNSHIYCADGTTLYTISHNEDADPVDAVQTSVLAADATGKQLIMTPSGEPMIADNGTSFLRYAHHIYTPVITEQEGVFTMTLQDITSDEAQAVSAAYPAEGMTATAGAYHTSVIWIEDVNIHILVYIAGYGVKHFVTVFDPVMNIFAGECRFVNDTFFFRLNENATEVVLRIEKEGNEIDAAQLGKLDKGYHRIANPFAAKDFDVFSVTASAQPVPFIYKVSDDSPAFQFYSSRGVAVDKNPNSPFYGRIYVTEGVGGKCTEKWYGTPSSFRKLTKGVFVLGCDFSDVTNQGANGWNGNITWGSSTTTNYQVSLFHPFVGPDGSVYVCSSSFSSTGVYVMNPWKPANDFTPVFSGTIDKNSGRISLGRSAVVSNPVMSCVVLGEGSEQKLYTYDRDNTASKVHCNINQYNLGELSALPWTNAPSRVFFNDEMTGEHMQNGFGEMAYDQRGGFFMSQYRANSNESVPALIHVNAQGQLDFNIAANGIDGAYQGGMGINADGTVIAVSGETGVIHLFDISWDDSNRPMLSPKFDIAWGDTGGGSPTGNTMAADFDPAGNLYIISNSNERLMVYSLPNTHNTHTTRVEIAKQSTDLRVNKQSTINTIKLLENGHVVILHNGRKFNILGKSL